MTEIRPFIRCTDYWPDGVPERKMDIYRRLIAEGQIRGHHIIVNRKTRATVVEYDAIAPHEWIREEMRKRI